MGKRKAPVAVFAIVVLAGTPLAAQQGAPELERTAETSGG